MNSSTCMGMRMSMGMGMCTCMSMCMVHVHVHVHMRVRARVHVRVRAHLGPVRRRRVGPSAEAGVGEGLAGPAAAVEELRVEPECEVAAAAYCEVILGADHEVAVGRGPPVDGARLGVCGV